jgi:AcrR family transcriptional regulator
VPEELKLASRRERHKDERRARIIEAARTLLREVGADDLSVKLIADRADVSAATIYNLFGTKGAVLAKVYQRDFEGFAAKAASVASASAIDAMFDTIRIVVDLYRSDPSFYRGMSIQNPGAEPELVASVHEPRRAFWQMLLERAIGQRDLEPDIRTDLISMAILQLSAGAFGYWCAELITIDEMELQSRYALARLLLGVARPSGRAKLLARIEDMERAQAQDEDQTALVAPRQI